MLENNQYIFSQFATHNALTASTIIEIGKNKDFEFQKLHGIGRALHNVRIYAQIGKLEELLAYLMRRMLENGANACFVNQVNNAIITLEHLTYNQYEHTINLTTTQSHFYYQKILIQTGKTLWDMT